MSAPREPARRRTRWVPVGELSPLARALLSEDLGGRDEVPGHVADRAADQAEEWAAHGFTAETVRPWKDASPDDAGYLAARGVDPAVLGLPIVAFPGSAPVALRLALATGRLTVERAYELLVLTGQHTPATVAPPAPTAPPAGPEPPAEPEPPARPRSPVAPIVFSHAPDG